MALYKTEAIVLRTRNLGGRTASSSLHARSGKVEGVAREAAGRKPADGATQLFTYGRYLVFSGRSLDTVSQAEIVESLGSGRLDQNGLRLHRGTLDVTVELESPAKTFELVHGTLAAVDRGLPPDLVASGLSCGSWISNIAQLEACVSCRTGGGGPLQRGKAGCSAWLPRKGSHGLAGGPLRRPVDEAPAGDG